MKYTLSKKEMIDRVLYKAFILLLMNALIVIFGNSYAQPWAWGKTADTAKGEHEIICMTVDGNNNVIAGGRYSRAIGFKNIILSSLSDRYHAFIAKYDSLGDVIWAKDLGVVSFNTSGGHVYVIDVVTDDIGNVYVCGKFNGLSIDFGGAKITNMGGFDGYLAKFDPNGNFIWAKSVSGLGGQQLDGIAYDPEGYIYVSGNNSVSSTVSFNSFQLNVDAQVLIIAKYDVDGNLTWAKSLPGIRGSNGYKSINNIGISSTGVYISGVIASDTVLVGKDTLINKDDNLNIINGDGCILKLDINGQPLWAKSYGSLMNDQNFSCGFGLAADYQNDCVYIYGNIEKENFYQNQMTWPMQLNFSDSVNLLIPSNDHYCFIAKYDHKGEPMWAKMPLDGRTKTSLIRSIALDVRGNVYVVGSADRNSTIFGDAFPLGQTGLFISKYNNLGQVVFAYDATASAENYSTLPQHYITPQEVAVDDYENVYVSGKFDFSSFVVFGKDTIREVGLSSDLCNLFVAKLATCSGSTSSGVLNLGACDTFVAPSGRYKWTHSGIYYDTIANSSGCDSFLTIHLKMSNQTNNKITIAACENYTSPSGKYTWNTSGTYTDIVPSHTGCDSVITFNLIINERSYSSFRKTECNSYTSPSGRYNWVTTGLFVDTIPNSKGCDSIITIQLTIVPNTLDTSVTRNNKTLRANATGVSYQWIDCNGRMPIVGAINRSFTPTQSGIYAVVVTDGCSDTSTCYQIDLEGNSIKQTKLEKKIRLYPNPADGQVHIHIEIEGPKSLSIIDVLGREVKTFVTQNRELVLDLKSYAEGMYLIYIQTIQGTVARKIYLSH